MKRVRILGLREDQPRVVSVLHEAGVVQLEQPDKDSLEIYKEATVPDYSRRVADQAFRFEGLVAALPPVPVSEKFEVGNIQQVLNEAEGVGIDDGVKKLKNTIESLDVKLNRSKTYLKSLAKISGFNKDLSVLGTTTLVSGFYAVPKDNFPRFQEELTSLSKDCIVENYGTKEEASTALVIIPRELYDSARVTFEKYKAVKLEVPQDLGTPAEATKKLEEETSSLEVKRKESQDALKKISEEYYGKILAIREALGIESQRLEALGKIGQSEKTFVLEGWVPFTRAKDLESAIETTTNGKFLIETVKTEEEPPTLMQNKKSINYFEFFVRFFSLPKEEEIDPTITFAVIFPIFFGLMLGDVGYGLVILLIAIWLVRLSQGKSSARFLPGRVRSFGRGMMSKRTLGSVGRILIPSSMAGIVFGVLFNEYFGAALPWYKPVLDIVRQVPILLLITVFIGMGHVTLGYVYGIYNGMRMNRKKDAYARIGWLSFLWSATLPLIVFFDRNLFPYSNIVAYAGLGVLFASAGVIIRNEGKTKFLLEIPTLISHVMSYARILGVLLASVLLASIVDSSLANSLARSPIVEIVFVGVIVLLTQILNIVLGIFEPSIQGARLHYVEFYTKFFEGNGRRFIPFAVRRNLTKVRPS